MTTSILWFRQDLRLADNPALDMALRESDQVIPVYIAADESAWPLGGASKWWLHQSLKSLCKDLQRLKVPLVIRHGEPVAVLKALQQETGADKLYYNRQYDVADPQKESELGPNFQKLGLQTRSFNGNLLLDPMAIFNQTGNPYQIYSAFWRACSAKLGPLKLSEKPTHWPYYPHRLDSIALEELYLEPKIHWDTGIRNAWTPGETVALKSLQSFVDETLINYVPGRDRPDQQDTSQLSPYLHFGEISPRQVWQAIREAMSQNKNARFQQSAETYLKELVWREFAYHLLYHFPHTVNQPLKPEFAEFPWADNPKSLKAWQQGKTGYPIVDAGMRQLWQTGWMHNRVRMIVASFLTKDLLIPWQQGAEWFWDTLVDADLASNTLGWQWVAGSGADASPYYRVFNPILQSQKFDPNGDYIRQWVPEIAGLDNTWIHKPWETPPLLLQQAKITLGETYPEPLVDHFEAKDKALDALKQIRKDKADAKR